MTAVASPPTHELHRLPPAAWEAYMRASHEVLTPSGLLQPRGGAQQWHGQALGLRWPLSGAVRDFSKVFTMLPDGLQGWNVRLRQDGGFAVCRVAGRPVTYGGFHVRDQLPAALAGRYPGALVLDYGRASAWTPLAPVRDVLVRVAPDLILGRMWLALGSSWRPTASYFTLTPAGTPPV